MSKTLNLTFFGKDAGDEQYPNPPGLVVLRLLADQLKKENWRLSEFENWRDSGWSLECRREGAQVEVVVIQTEDENWMLSAYPLRLPGFIFSLFGAKPSAKPDDVLAVARSVQTTLISQNKFKEFRWRWDGFPDETDPSEVPMPE